MRHFKRVNNLTRKMSQFNSLIPLQKPLKNVKKKVKLARFY